MLLVVVVCCFICLCAAGRIRWSVSQKNKDASIIIPSNVENPWVMLLISSAAYYLVLVLCRLSLTDPDCLLTSHPDKTHGKLQGVKTKAWDADEILTSIYHQCKVHVEPWCGSLLWLLVFAAVNLWQSIWLLLFRLHCDGNEPKRALFLFPKPCRCCR